ncbi:hypothetical protein QPL79_02610 [Ignisphaera sp. 4213-co]|uniref:DUF4443 domain-containing protein n=1 Tax=Ignisphaera cupida TaxID=3050454 RepID=A0ABD4Z4K4_9CREN|nr:DUF4443 domain-containing protein [Ignisphaera sp. 4213-co]MDK6028256.1 hypothetical protein [Ignisphaera sp. 4213-co]
MSNLKNLFYEIAASRKGVKPLFEPAHVLKTLLLLYEKEPIGRNVLSRMLGIGVASTRTLIKRLKEYDLVNVDYVGGCILTERGKRVIERIMSVVRRIENSTAIIEEDLRLAPYSWLAVLDNSIELVKKFGIVNIRDKLIGYGAKAALIVFVEEFAYIPPDKELNEKKYSTLRNIRSSLLLKFGDVAIISFANGLNVAEKALLNTLIDVVLDTC